MKVLARSLLATALLVPAVAAAQPYLVVFKSDQVPADTARLVAGYGGRLSRSYAPIGVVSVDGDAAFAGRIAGDKRVFAVGPEHVFTASEPLAQEASPAMPAAQPLPSDNLYGLQWDMRRVNAPAVWARLPLAAVKPCVAVLDVGTMDDHPDLAGQVDASYSTSYCSTSGGPGATAGYPVYASYIDFDAFPDWTPADGCSPEPANYEPHGTHVAGTIAAKFGGGRVVGVAPDASIGVYKVFDHYRYTDPVAGRVERTGAFDGPLFAAIIDATQRGYPVISMSLGGEIFRNQKGSAASWQAWSRVAKWADRNGALLVAAAGNEEFDLNGVIAHVPSDIPSIVSVSASATSDLVAGADGLVAAPGSDILAFYSNYGASSIDITAPGGDCGPGAACDPDYLILNDYIRPDSGAAAYAWMAGTSMATPHVSAVAAQVRSMHPSWTTGHVRAWLKSSAQNLGNRQYFGAGMLDADAATR